MKYLLITEIMGVTLYSDYDKFTVAVVASEKEGLYYIDMDLSLLAGSPTGRYSFWVVDDNTASSVVNSYNVNQA